MTNKRKPGQSQLDYLWTNFGNVEVSNQISETPSNEVVLTESAVVEIIKSQSGTKDFIIDSVIVDDDTVALQIKDQQGTVLSQTTITRGARIIEFRSFVSTQEDADNGVVSEVGIQCIQLKDSIGQIHTVELPSLIGQETESIITTVKNNKVAAQIKLDNPIVEKSIELGQTANGIQAKLIVNGKSPIKVDKTDDGIFVHQTWEGEPFDLKVKEIKLNDYLLLSDIDKGTLYFVTDVPCIYFRRVKFGSNEQFSQILDNYYNKSEVDKLIPTISTMTMEEAAELIKQIFE